MVSFFQKESELSSQLEKELLLSSIGSSKYLYEKEGHGDTGDLTDGHPQGVAWRPHFLGLAGGVVM